MKIRETKQELKATIPSIKRVGICLSECRESNLLLKMLLKIQNQQSPNFDQFSVLLYLIHLLSRYIAPLLVKQKQK